MEQIYPGKKAWPAERCQILAICHGEQRTQTIYNGTKHTLVVTYIQLNESRMSKTQ